MTHTLKYGSPHSHLVNQAVANFTDARYSRLSFTTTPVEVLSNDGKDDILSHGTGFFWRDGGIDWVITCWHVISGRNPFTQEFLSPNNLIPKRIRVWGWQINALGENVEFKRTGWTIDIPESTLEKLAHPTMIGDQIVDMAALPLPANFALQKGLAGGPADKFGDLEACLNLQNFDKISTQVGDECVIIGYPLQNYTGLLFPIWKRGSIATETNMGVDETPAFLIDAATSSAMSGSAVLRLSAALPTLEKYTGVIKEQRGYEIIGIYAGRLKNNELERINIGYAWFSTLIPLIVESYRQLWMEAVKEISETRPSVD